MASNLLIEPILGNDTLSLHSDFRLSGPCLHVGGITLAHPFTQNIRNKNK